MRSASPHRVFIGLILVGVLSVTLTAQSDGGLTRDRVRAAVTSGFGHAGVEHGLHLVDVGSTLFSGLGQALASQGKLTPGTEVSGTGFEAILYTPLTWIAQQASEAPSPFADEEITPDMLRPVLRVIGVPSAPPNVGPNYGLGVSPVVNVFLTDAGRKRVLQPSSRQPFVRETWRGLIAEFSLDDLADLRTKDPEFRVVVVGTNGNRKEFTVKKKHFVGLPLG